MAKNLWVAGESGNRNGRPAGSKYSVLTTKGRLERFLAKNMTSRALQAMYIKLSPKEQYEFLVELLPYVMPKQTGQALTSDDVDRIYDEIMKQVEQNGIKLDAKAR